MSALEIRRLGARDVDAVLAASALFDKPPTVERAKAFLAKPGHHLLVAYRDGEPAGFISAVEIAHPDKDVELLIYELGTHEDHRRRGVATALIGALRELGKRLGSRGTWVVTETDNDAARATYKSVGADVESVVIYNF